MPDNENLLNTQELEDSVSIDNLTQSPDLDGDDVIVMVHENNGVKSTYKAILRSIANFINKLLHYSTDLHTQNDTIIGAINELADGGGGGGSTNIISEASGAIATFSDGGDNIPVKSLVTDIVAVQSGTGTPSPSNPRSISGFDEVDVVVNGENFIDFSTAQLRPVQEGSSTERVGFAPVMLAAGTYHIRKTFDGTASQLYVQDYETGTNIANNNTSEFDFTISATTNVIIRTTAQTMAQFNLTSLLCVLKSDCTTHTITLPETIYGGSLDVSTGDGVKTFGYNDLASYSGTVVKVSSGSTAYFRFDDIIAKQNGTIISDKFEQVVITGSTSFVGISIGKPSTLDHATIFFRPENPDSYTTATILTYIQNTLNGLQVAYELATPTTFNTTPEQITTLSGTNNIYSNSGDVEVEYFNENADQMAALIRAMTYTSETILLTLSCPRTQSSDLQYEVYNHVIARNCKMSIQVSGLTDCGSNDAYIALLVNGVEIQRGTLITDSSTQIVFSAVDVTQGDIVRLIFGWANNHSAYFNGTGKMVLS